MAKKAGKRADQAKDLRVEMKVSAGAAAAITSSGFDFGSADKKLGVKGLVLRLKVDGVEQAVRYKSARSRKTRIEAEGAVGGSLLRCRTELDAVRGLKAVTVRHTLVNPTGREVWVSDVVTTPGPETGGVLLGSASSLDFRYCHTDNVRTEHYPYCQGEFPYVRNLPTHPLIAGTGEDQPFPAIYFTNKHWTQGLVIGAVSQDLAYQSWEFCKEALIANSVFSLFAIHHDLAQAPGLRIAPKGRIVLDGTFFQLVENTHPQDAYVGYVNFLAKRCRFRGPKTVVRREAFHCTWNYGVFAEQYEDALLKTARFTASHFPNIKTFLMDAGYMTCSQESGSLGGNFIDRFYPDANASVDRKKFPRGIRHFSDALRKLGLRPGIWWSPTAILDSRLAQDHPDWFLRDASGNPYRIGRANGFLDLSVPAAAAYVDRVLGVLVDEWGFEALKMDFWSQNFEDRHVRLARVGHTGVTARKILFDIVRKHLPKDGIFMTCVATGMGNPFIGLHADTYRNTIDIGTGLWSEQINNCLWALPTLSIEGRKTLLLNNDSFGFNLSCPDNENFFRMTWGFITMGLQETGGRLEELPEPYVKALRKFTDRCDRGYRVCCPDDRAFTGEPLPEVLYVNYPDDSPTRKAGIAQSLALFNWTDDPRVVAVARTRLGQQGGVKAVNFWTGEPETFDDEFIVKRLAGRSALLYDIQA